MQRRCIAWSSVEFVMLDNCKCTCLSNTCTHTGVHRYGCKEQKNNLTLFSVDLLPGFIQKGSFSLLQSAHLIRLWLSDICTTSHYSSYGLHQSLVQGFHKTWFSHLFSGLTCQSLRKYVFFTADICGKNFAILLAYIVLYRIWCS